MLELRPNCECCGRDLDPSAADAMICTFECTFCVECARDRLDFVCPVCDGNLVSRPIRPASWIDRYPASKRRTRVIEGCSQ